MIECFSHSYYSEDYILLKVTMCQLTEGYSMEYKYKQDNIPSAIARAIFEMKNKIKKVECHIETFTLK